MPRFLRPRRSQTAAPGSGPGTAGDLQLSAESPHQLGQSAQPTGPSPTQSAASPRPDPNPAALAASASGAAIAGLETTEHSTPGFGQRGRLRRRLHFLRKARELAYRDLGGLVFDLHRFGKRHDELVVAKLATLTHIDAELRALESALEERQSLAVLREAGIAACPRCAAIHGSDDRFCPSCGMPVGVEGPLAAPMVAAPISEAPQPAQPPLSTPPQSVQPPPSVPPQPAQPPVDRPPKPPTQSAPAPGQSAPSSVRSGSTLAPDEEHKPLDIPRKADEAQSGEEDQPTQILDSEQRPRVGEQPTQGFDSPSVSG